MKKLFVLFIMGLVFLMAPLMVNAAEFTGSIQGLTCVTQGKVCPIGKEDAVIAAENVFVLLVDAAKGEYYFIPNLDRGVLARHINEPIKIVGMIDQMKAKSIIASEVYTMGANNSWNLVWSQAWQNDIYKDLQGGYPARGTATQPSGQ
jgi:hypothetical protein